MGEASKGGRYSLDVGGPGVGGDTQPWPWRGHAALGTEHPALEGTRSPTYGGVPGKGDTSRGTGTAPSTGREAAPEGRYSPGDIPGTDQPAGHGESHPQRESPARDVTTVPPSSPSRDMPTSRHFLKRHCWQRLRLMRTIEQFSFLRHFLYWMFCWMLRRKKPCGASGGNHWGSLQCDRGSVPHPRPQPSTLQPSQAWTP